MEQKSIQQRWEKPVIRLGVVTNIIGILLMFIPGLYLCIRYDAWIGFTAFKNALMVCLVYFGINWFIEPLSYYPPVGTVGTYMSWLGGSMTSAKIPAAATAKALLGVDDGTQEADVVTVYSIYGATISNAIVLTLIAFFGTLLLAVLPDSIKTALSNYIMPSLFGSMLAMFGCELPVLTIPVFVVMILIYVLMEAGIFTIPSAILPLLAVVGSIVYARIMYKKGLLFKGKTR